MHHPLENLVESTTPGEIIVIEGPRGGARQALLEQAVADARAAGAGAWLLPCAVSEAGLWAGASTLFESLLPLARQYAPELIEQHHLELSPVVPGLADELESSETLTDAATGVEAVRNYALDRAYRIPHGLIDFMESLFQRAPVPARRILVCYDFERSGVLVRRFFHQLMRRRGEKLAITLVLVIEQGHTARTLKQVWGPDFAPRTERLELEPEAPEPLTPRDWALRALALEKQVRGNKEETEFHVPELVRMWLKSNYPDRARYWQAFALARYNHRGFYEDAASFIDGVLEDIDQVVTLQGFTRWNLVGGIFGCLVAIGQPERAYEVVMKEAVPKVTDPAERARVMYVLAMAHARFLPERNLERAGEFLLEGLRLLDVADIEPELRHFLKVFLNNGLALVRHRQGYPAEAIELCREGFRQLSENIPGDRHRLHRSVLLYNIAQVYTATRDFEQAIEYFTGAMEMDPNYSEYFNERGNAYLKLGRYEEAIRDYHEAMRLSPPYPEVWTNLGQCLRRLGRFDDAEAAYARAIDLDPSVNLAHAGRAHALDVLGRHAEALAEYDETLRLDPAQAPMLANRAVLHYRMGNVERALADLDAAVQLEPALAALYRNRARALTDLGRGDDATRDLERYLELSPAAPDRAEVESWIESLRGALVAA
ncbi:MAG TPA: tetratricopeptide repeat protein [Longimicrobium sp.]|nr:tetratricopeptide repeat protein [Longimicrobium sp.]